MKDAKTEFAEILGASPTSDSFQKALEQLFSCLLAKRNDGDFAIYKSGEAKPLDPRLDIRIKENGFQISQNDHVGDDGSRGKQRSSLLDLAEHPTVDATKLFDALARFNTDQGLQ